MSMTNDWDPQGYDDQEEDPLPVGVTIKTDEVEGEELEEGDQPPKKTLDDPDAPLDGLAELEILEKNLDEPPLRMGIEEDV